VGFARRVVRKSIRTATPRPVRQALHPARTVKNAVTPQPVRQASRTAYTVFHPVAAAENEAIGAVLKDGSGRRQSRQGRFGDWLDRRRSRDLPQQPPSATAVSETDSGRAVLSGSAVMRLLQRGAVAEARGHDLVIVRDGRLLARKRFSSAELAAATAQRVNGATAAWRTGRSESRAVEPELSPAGEPEMDVRRHVGLGGDWQA
jgi:hypothetical protein